MATTKPLSKLSSEEILAEHRTVTRYYTKEMQQDVVTDLWEQPTREAAERYLRESPDSGPLLEAEVCTGCEKRYFHTPPAGRWYVDKLPADLYSIHPDNCPVRALDREIRRAAHRFMVSDCRDLPHRGPQGPNEDLSMCPRCMRISHVMRPWGETFGTHDPDCSLPIWHESYCQPGGNGHPQAPTIRG